MSLRTILIAILSLFLVTGCEAEHKNLNYDLLSLIDQSQYIFDSSNITINVSNSADLGSTNYIKDNPKNLLLEWFDKKVRCRGSKNKIIVTVDKATIKSQESVNKFVAEYLVNLEFVISEKANIKVSINCQNVREISGEVSLLEKHDITKEQLQELIILFDKEFDVKVKAVLGKYLIQ